MIAPPEHQSIYAEGHVDWREGFMCSECSERRDANKARHRKEAPMFGNRTQMRDYEYTSVGVLEKEIVANARRAGIEPERYQASQEKGYKSP